MPIIHTKYIGQYSSLILIMDLCNRVVTGRQHAIECDYCNKWLHQSVGHGWIPQDNRMQYERLIYFHTSSSACKTYIRICVIVVY